MRFGGPRETVALTRSNAVGKQIVTVELVLQVTRDEHNRLIGSVRAGADDVRTFSGTLELMRVFEELVPADGGAGWARSAKSEEGA